MDLARAWTGGAISRLGAAIGDVFVPFFFDFFFGVFDDGSSDSFVV